MTQNLENHQQFHSEGIISLQTDLFSPLLEDQLLLSRFTQGTSALSHHEAQTESGVTEEAIDLLGCLPFAGGVKNHAKISPSKEILVNVSNQRNMTIPPNNEQASPKPTVKETSQEIDAAQRMTRKRSGSAPSGPKGRTKRPCTGKAHENNKKTHPVSRKDNSLGRLTQKFMSLVTASEDGILDLNAVATELSVQKRRIYDITNVLEGIGLIVKKSKNNIQWKGITTTSHPKKNEEDTKLKTDLDQLLKEEKDLDEKITEKQQLLKELENPKNASIAYVSHNDIRNIPSLADQTIIAVKAPSGTKLEVPDPDENMEPGRRRYQIFLKSPKGEIDVFLVSKLDETLLELTDPLGENPGLLKSPELSSPPLDYFYGVELGVSDIFTG